MKSKTKKLLALVMALAMVMSLLAGCGGDSGKSNTLTNEELLNMNEEDLQNYQGSTGHIRDNLTIAFTGATSLTPWGTSNNTPGNVEVYECLFLSDILRSSRSSVRITASTSSPTFIKS